jgi:hypothetical protein
MEARVSVGAGPRARPPCPSPRQWDGDDRGGDVSGKTWRFVANPSHSTESRCGDNEAREGGRGGLPLRETH